MILTGRQVKCDCTRPKCSECRKRESQCVYQEENQRPTFSKPEIPLLPGFGQTNDASPELRLVSQHTMKDLKSSDYSCQFVGDTMSILVETDDVGVFFSLRLVN